MREISIAEDIRCRICTNFMKTSRGCDGFCQYDKELIKEIEELERLAEIGKLIETLGTRLIRIQHSHLGRYYVEIWSVDNLLRGWSKGELVDALWEAVNYVLREEG